jgi:DNA polymerase
MEYCSIDFETRSQTDLISEGIYRYATDPTTQVLMMGWAFGDDPAVVWTPDQPFPQRIIDHVKAGGEIRAWNAQFERLIWWYVLGPDFDLPEPTLEQFRCTAARARAHGLPGGLKDAARALELPMQKQEAGQRLIKLYCVPGHKEEIPADDWALFLDYCRMDVEVERQLPQFLRDLTDSEWQDYWANERINDRGVPVDVPFAIAAQAYGKDIKIEADRQISVLTSGEVPNARSRSKRNAWLLPKLLPHHLEVLTENKVMKFGKPRREELLLQEDLHKDVRRFTELVDEAGGATLGKYQAFADRALDGRLRGAFMFSGGGQTGRYSSTGIQLHNLRRDVFDEPQDLIDTIMRGEPVQEPTKALSRLVRAVISHPDGLTWVDYSNIEGRMAPWLEGTELGEDKLDMFRKGLDPYKVNASATFNVPYEAVSKEQRQAGKVQELALQFGGGVGALQSMGGTFGLEISDDYGTILRDGWRAVNPWMAAFGRKLEKAVRTAIKVPQVWHEAGRVAYAYDGTDWLWCKLPSGRLLAYHAPRFEEVVTPWGEEVMAVTALWGGSKPKAGAPWPRRPLVAGLLIENCTQAASACLLRDALRKCDTQGIEVVMHVHDEIVAQNVDKERLRSILTDAPAWAAGLPIQASAETGVRYGK